MINNLGRGGAERVFVNQINHLHQRGDEVYLGLLFPSVDDSYQAELLLPPANILQIASTKRSSLGLLFSLNHLVRRNNFTIIYSTLELPNILARLIKIINPKIRVVIREGSAVIDKKGQVSVKALKFKLIDIFLNWLPSSIVAVSNEIAGILKSYQPFYAHKIKVVENGVIISESMADIDKRLGQKLNQPQFNVLAAASMNYYERAFEYLIEAISLLPKDLLKETQLTFAGDGTLRPIYEKQVKELNLENQIKFLGRLNTSELVSQYKKADVFVLCSTSEGSPNVLLEAMSYGVPVITTPVGGALNMVKDGQSGFFVPFKDAQAIANKLIWLISHRQEGQKMGFLGYKNVFYHFAFKKKMDQMVDILKLDK